jgi:release factor glutamine methyltransferase
MGTSDNLTEQLLAEGVAELAAAGSRLDAELLLAHALAMPRSALHARGRESAPAAAAARYRALLARRAAGEPVAYLTGEREFWSLPLRVSAATLIPRPETELVVERTLALLADATEARRALRIADLGTGCGAIALALASERPHWQITATDRSTVALEVARSNAARLQLERIEFIAGDWLRPLAARRFEAIVCNPPYVAASDAALPALRYEPAEALTSGPDGLEALRHLAAAAPPHLEPGGWLVLEHGATQARELGAALVAAGYARVRCHRDLAGHDRVTEAQRP